MHTYEQSSTLILGTLQVYSSSTSTRNFTLRSPLVLVTTSTFLLSLCCWFKVVHESTIAAVAPPGGDGDGEREGSRTDSAQARTRASSSGLDKEEKRNGRASKGAGEERRGANEKDQELRGKATGAQNTLIMPTLRYNIQVGGAVWITGGVRMGGFNRGVREGCGVIPFSEVW